MTSVPPAGAVAIAASIEYPPAPDGQLAAVSAGDVEVRGNTKTGRLARVVFAVDVSGTTGSPRGLDCIGDGASGSGATETQRALDDFGATPWGELTPRFG